MSAPAILRGSATAYPCHRIDFPPASPTAIPVKSMAVEGKIR
jgi:hypothetical protein